MQAYQLFQYGSGQQMSIAGQPESIETVLKLSENYYFSNTVLKTKC